MKRVTNVSTRAVGLPGGVTLPAGEFVDLELSKEDEKLLKGFEHVEVSDVDRSPRSKDQGGD
jgi:hypothetical protein